MDYENYDSHGIRQKWLDEQKKTGGFEKLQMQYRKCIGLNHGKRHLVTNKEFKPLKDLLGQADCDITVELHKMICDTPGVEQFVMSPEVALEVHRLTKTFTDRPQDLEKWLPKVKPPYPHICVEYPLTEDTHDLRLPVQEGMSQLARVGAFIDTREEGDDIIIMFSPYYEFESGYVISSHVILVNQDNKPMSGFIPIKLYPHEIVWNATFHPSVFKAAKDAKLSIEEFWKRVGNTPDILKAMATEAMEELPTLFFSWLILLNSKSGVTKTKVQARIPNPKLGKRERARRGRSGYTVVSLTDTENVDSEGLVTPKQIISAHRVRGHFKMKKWGVFWWRPHVRGVGELKDREAYKIVA